jgi:hypothetical protein
MGTYFNGGLSSLDGWSWKTLGEGQPYYDDLGVERSYYAPTAPLSALVIRGFAKKPIYGYTTLSGALTRPVRVQFSLQVNEGHATAMPRPSIQAAAVFTLPPELNIRLNSGLEGWPVWFSCSGNGTVQYPIFGGPTEVSDTAQTLYCAQGLVWNFWQEHKGMYGPEYLTARSIPFPDTKLQVFTTRGVQAVASLCTYTHVPTPGALAATAAVTTFEDVSGPSTFTVPNKAGGNVLYSEYFIGALGSVGVSATEVQAFYLPGLKFASAGVQPVTTTPTGPVRSPLLTSSPGTGAGVFLTECDWQGTVFAALGTEVAIASFSGWNVPTPKWRQGSFSALTFSVEVIVPLSPFRMFVAGAADMAEVSLGKAEDTLAVVYKLPGGVARPGGTAFVPVEYFVLWWSADKQSVTAIATAEPGLPSATAPLDGGDIPGPFSLNYGPAFVSVYFLGNRTWTCWFVATGLTTASLFFIKIIVQISDGSISIQSAQVFADVTCFAPMYGINSDLKNDFSNTPVTSLQGLQSDSTGGASTSFFVTNVLYTDPGNPTQWPMTLLRTVPQTLLEA